MINLMTVIKISHLARFVCRERVGEREGGMGERERERDRETERAKERDSGREREGWGERERKGKRAS